MKRENRLARILAKKRSDGSFYFSDEDLGELIPALFLQTGVELGSAPRWIKGLVVEVAHKAGVVADMSPKEILASLSAYYAAHPLNPKLLEAYRKELRRTPSPEPIAAASTFERTGTKR